MSRFNPISVPEITPRGLDFQAPLIQSGGSNISGNNDVSSILAALGQGLGLAINIKDKQKARADALAKENEEAAKALVNESLFAMQEKYKDAVDKHKQAIASGDELLIREAEQRLEDVIISTESQIAPIIDDPTVSLSQRKLAVDFRSAVRSSNAGIIQRISSTQEAVLQAEQNELFNEYMHQALGPLSVDDGGYRALLAGLEGLSPAEQLHQISLYVDNYVNASFKEAELTDEEISFITQHEDYMGSLRKASTGLLKRANKDLEALKEKALKEERLHNEKVLLDDVLFNVALGTLSPEDGAQAIADTLPSSYSKEKASQFILDDLSNAVHLSGESIPIDVVLSYEQLSYVAPDRKGKYADTLRTSVGREIHKLVKQQDIEGFNILMEKVNTLAEAEDFAYSHVFKDFVIKPREVPMTFRAAFDEGVDLTTSQGRLSYNEDRISEGFRTERLSEVLSDIFNGLQSNDFYELHTSIDALKLLSPRYVGSLLNSRDLRVDERIKFMLAMSTDFNSPEFPDAASIQNYLSNVADAGSEEVDKKIEKVLFSDGIKSTERHTSDNFRALVRAKVYQRVRADGVKLTIDEQDIKEIVKEVKSSYILDTGFEPVFNMITPELNNALNKSRHVDNVDYRYALESDPTIESKMSKWFGLEHVKKLIGVVDTDQRSFQFGPDTRGSINTLSGEVRNSTRYLDPSQAVDLSNGGAISVRDYHMVRIASAMENLFVDNANNPVGFETIFGDSPISRDEQILALAKIWMDSDITINASSSGIPNVIKLEMIGDNGDNYDFNVRADLFDAFIAEITNTTGGF